jgi:hypothetical protein
VKNVKNCRSGAELLQGLNQNFFMVESGAPGGLELPTFWFVASQPTLPNLARADASEAESISWDNTWQFTFSFTLLFLFANYHYLPLFASQFRDS